MWLTVTHENFKIHPTSAQLFSKLADKGIAIGLNPRPQDEQNECNLQPLWLFTFGAGWR